MDKIVNILTNNKFFKGAIVLGGVAASAYILYTGLTEGRAEQPTTKIVTEADLKSRIEEIMSTAEISQYEQYHYYDLQTLMKLTDLCSDLAIPEFKEFALQCREERRQLMNCDRNKYYESIIEYNNKLHILLSKQSEKLEQFDCFKEEYMRASVSIFMKEPDYQQKIVFSLAKVKSSIATEDSNLTIEDAQSIVAFFISYIKSQPEILVHLIKYLVSTNQINQVFFSLKIALYDQLYLEKGFEEEDFLIPGMSPEYLQDPITHRLQQAYSQAVSSFIEYHQS